MQLFEVTYQWIPWIEFGLMFLLVFIYAAQPHALGQGIQTLTNPIQRRYMDGENKVIDGIRWLFQVGILSFTALYGVAAWLPQHPMLNLLQYAYMLIITTIVVTFKRGLDHYLYSTFRYAVHAPTYFYHQHTLGHLTCLILFLYLLLAPHLCATAQWMIPGVLGVVYIIITQWKLIALFGPSLDHIFYITLYILHAEMMPMIVMLAGAYQILTHII